MPSFEKFRESNALAEISRKLKAGELLGTTHGGIPNQFSIESSSTDSKRDCSSSEKQEEGPSTSHSLTSSSLKSSKTKTSSSPSISSLPCSSSSSDCTSQENEREGEEDGLQYKELYQEFIDDDVMAMLESSADRERNDIHACLYAIEYVLSRS